MFTSSSFSHLCLRQRSVLFQAAGIGFRGKTMLRVRELWRGSLARVALAIVLCIAARADASAQNAQPSRETPAANPRAQTADKTITTVDLTTSLCAPTVGDTVDVTATVAKAPGSAKPTGAVSFYSIPEMLVYAPGATSPQLDAAVPGQRRAPMSSLFQVRPRVTRRLRSVPPLLSPCSNVFPAGGCSMSACAALCSGQHFRCRWPPCGNRRSRARRPSCAYWEASRPTWPCTGSRYTPRYR